MRQIDTDALRLVSSSLGIGNPSGATAATDFDDDLLQQVLNVGGLISRGRTPFPSSGIFGANIANVHGAANELSTDFNPYRISASGLTAQSPWPDPVPDDMDVWLLGASGFTTVAATVTVASLQLVHQAPTTAFGDITAGVSPMYALWIGSTSKGTGTEPMIGTLASSVWQGRPMRLRRDVTCRWRSVAAGAATLSLNLMLGLFPAGFGQDAL